MPELPEVEFVKNELSILLPKGTKVKELILKRKSLRSPIDVKWLPKLKGATLQEVVRRAKYLLFRFEDFTMISHLGMTGSWRIKEVATLKKHDHLILKLFDQRELVYHDPRRFGSLDFCNREEEASSIRLAHLGPEPFGFTGKELFLITRKKDVAIKNLIMNQQVVVGVGNIYASEALFRAKIRPQKKAKLLTQNECSVLVEEIQKILLLAIQSGGSSIHNYVHASGESGSFQHRFFVYGREGESCKKCDKKISAMVLGGRSTFYCSKCQK